MNMNTNNDLTEEDAADLQFPKEQISSLNISNSYNDPLDMQTNQIKSTCSNCFNELNTPFIFCVECQLSICTLCFCNGAEFLNHKNDHSYQVHRDDFILFENSDWTAKEELTMLDSLLRYGNWNSVANELTKKNVKDIKEHYDYFYIKRKGSDLLPMIKETQASAFPEKIVPYRIKINNSEDPPRFLPNTAGYNSLAGYNPARSDFESEYDGNAEDILSELKPIDEDDPHYEMLSKLQCLIIQSYNRRLKERQRWKDIVRKHGLILVRKTHHWLSRYDLTITKPVYMKLVKFMQLCDPQYFQFLMEGLHRAGELKLHISRLCNLRLKGITTLGGAQLYFKLNNLHEECNKELKIFQKQSKYKWKQAAQNAVVPTNFFINKKRQSFAPLDIVGMPGYENLSLKEKDLCSKVRLTPNLYFELKSLLVSENKKLGHIKLQTARRMLKIDVNKTRKLFDFLVEEGYITKQ